MTLNGSTYLSMHPKPQIKLRLGSSVPARCVATLAIPLGSADIRAGRVAVDEPLANRVRSGRKQP